MGDEDFQNTIELVGKVVDGLGVATIIVGITLAAVAVARRRAEEDPLRRFRQGVGRAVLLGLEILVAADIIRTVAVEPSFQSAGVLAIIVLIRTFLSFTLELELTGRWPWQSGSSAGGGASGEGGRGSRPPAAASPAGPGPAPSRSDG
jgi:uncharacterized membrane protein